MMAKQHQIHKLDRYFFYLPERTYSSFDVDSIVSERTGLLDSFKLKLLMADREAE